MYGRFTRKAEDFECRECGLMVIGSGYTNHCPRCLWSMHVDVNPGDRACPCRGMMEPASAVYGRGFFRIMHRCVECGMEKNVSSSEGDSAEALVELADSERMLS